MRLVVIESPYSGEVDRNVAYARRALRDSLARGEAPLASHLLYTQVLDDTLMPDRVQGMGAGHAWIAEAYALVVYMDYGVSRGMWLGIDVARARDVPIEFRSIGTNPEVAP